MSTILHALRKTKADKEKEAPEDGVLRNGMQNIIDKEDGETREDPPAHLRGIVFGSLCVLAVLGATLIALYLRGQAHQIQKANTPPRAAARTKPALSPATTPQSISPPARSLFASEQNPPEHFEPTQPPTPLALSQQPEPVATPESEWNAAQVWPLDPPEAIEEEEAYDEEPPYIEPDEPPPPQPRRRQRDNTSVIDQLTVNGIFFDKESPPLAMINGESVRVGSTISGAKVTEIRKDAVVVRLDGKDYELSY